MSTVTISLKAAELLHAWLKNVLSMIHMKPESPEYDALIELHGAIEDSHYESKQGTIVHDVKTEDNS